MGTVCGLLLQAKATNETLGPVGSLTPENYTNADGPDYNHD